MSPRKRPPDPWPWPGDSVLDRARRVAREYRDALAATDPQRCAALDQRVVELGQPWIVPQPVTVGPDDLLTAEQLADYAQVGVRTINEWRRRGLEAVDTVDGPRYRPRDLIAWDTRRRERRTGATRRREG